MAESKQTKRNQSIGRRRFLGAAMAGTGILGCASARPRPPRTRRVLGANDRIRMGIIGSGGMGRHHMNVLKKQGVDWIAVCDIYDQNLKEGLKIAGENAKAYHEHEKLLENNDVDAVLIASPEHWHHNHLIDTVRAGFDAYCEKPMCHSIAEGANMVKEVEKSGCIVQIGMQRRSSPIIHKIKNEIFDSGELGNIHVVRASWYWNWKIDTKADVPGHLDWERFCGPAGPQKYDPLKFRYWRWWWAFSGGNETDQGTHLMDVVQWMMGVHQPKSAIQFGQVYENMPSETPDTFSCVFEYPKFMATWTLGYTTNTYRNGWVLVFQGTKKSLMLSEAGYRVFDQVNDWRDGMPKPERAELPGGVTSTEPHTKNFLDCLRTRKQPNATVQRGYEGVRPLHLANAALAAGSKATLGADGVAIRT